MLTRIHNNEHYLEKRKIKQENERLLRSIENPKRSVLTASGVKRNQSAQQRLRKLRFENNLLENKILNAEPIVSTFQKTVSMFAARPYNKLNESGSLARSESTSVRMQSCGSSWPRTAARPARSAGAAAG